MKSAIEFLTTKKFSLLVQLIAFINAATYLANHKNGHEIILPILLLIVFIIQYFGHVYERGPDFQQSSRIEVVFKKEDGESELEKIGKLSLCLFFINGVPQRKMFLDNLYEITKLGQMTSNEAKQTYSLLHSKVSEIHEKSWKPHRSIGFEYPDKND